MGFGVISYDPSLECVRAIRICLVHWEGPKAILPLNKKKNTLEKVAVNCNRLHC